MAEKMTDAMWECLHWRKEAPCFKCEPEKTVDIYELKDARGISCGLVCERCAPARIRSYRPDIFSNASYDHDEALEEERY